VVDSHGGKRRIGCARILGPGPFGIRARAFARSDRTGAPRSRDIAKRFQRAVQLRWLLLDLRSPPPCAYSQARVRVARCHRRSLRRLRGRAVVLDGRPAWRDELLDAIAETIHPEVSTNRSASRPLGGQAPADPATRARGDEAPLEVCRGGRLSFCGGCDSTLGVASFRLRLGRDSVARGPPSVAC